MKAMLEKMLPESATDDGEVTLIEIPVSDKIAGKQVHELNLPHNVLITTQVHNGKLLLGDESKIDTNNAY